METTVEHCNRSCLIEATLESCENILTLCLTNLAKVNSFNLFLKLVCLVFQAVVTLNMLPGMSSVRNQAELESFLLLSLNVLLVRSICLPVCVVAIKSIQWNICHRALLTLCRKLLQTSNGVGTRLAPGVICDWNCVLNFFI